MVHDVTVHILGAAIYELLKFLVATFLIDALQKWLTKAGLSHLASRAIHIGVSCLILAFFFYSALRSHQLHGFDNGVIFATDCFLLLILAVAISYPLIRKMLPTGVKQLDWTHPDLWNKRTSSGGSVALASSMRKMLRLQAQFVTDTDRWMQIERWFSEPQDFRGWVGIRVQITSDDLHPGSGLRLHIVMLNKTQYISANLVSFDKKSVTFLFQEMKWAEWSAPDTLGYLDLKQVSGVILGCNATTDNIGFRVGKFELVKYSDAGG